MVKASKRCPLLSKRKRRPNNLVKRLKNRINALKESNNLNETVNNLTTLAECHIVKTDLQRMLNEVDHKMVRQMKYMSALYFFLSVHPDSSLFSLLLFLFCLFSFVRKC
jgi:hypothetical protein